jgi:predicted nucleic acid-binding protein
MMLDRAVINSGPLIALSLLGRLDILPLVFKEFWIPDAVYQEVAIAGIGRTGADDLINRGYRRCT